MTIEAGRDRPATVPDGAGSWHRVPDDRLPADGRVTSVVVDGGSLAMSRCGVRLGALENRCPHQGRPLGEGSIETTAVRYGIPVKRALLDNSALGKFAKEQIAAGFPV